MTILPVIAGTIANGTIPVANILTNTSEVGAAVCDFVTANITLGNVTTSVTIYNPAHCGVYGYYPSLQPLLSLVLVFMTVWALFGNGCLLYLICTERQMKEPGNIFLCALALTDIAQILLYAPTAVYNLVHEEIPGEGWCRVQAFLTSSLATFSVYLKASLWVCRFIHIAFPLDYSSLMSKRRLAVTMTICFLIAMTPPLVGIARVGTLESWTVDVSSVDIAQPLSLMLPCTVGGHYVIVFVTLSMIAVLISCVTAGLIFRVAWNNEKTHTKLTGIANHQFNQKLQAAKTLAIITGVQLATWCPVIIAGLLWNAEVITVDKQLILVDISFVIMMTSTFTDSIVYAKRKNIYRRTVEKIHSKISKYFERKKELESIPMRTLRRTEDI
ncbi:putative trace amine-associated receptor 3 [Branchiostoma floridae]|uniref:Trace amine-associated receptor 3 n=1 Tax=Branchiostoma floridae TaxID=7739 RepID=A0A9J7LR78_BRAFL|nr:putative trace amine-associated receptor 3 [Branchiostoma floridae]